MYVKCFNNYFTSIGQELASKLPPVSLFIPPETPDIHAFTFPLVIPEFVQQLLQNMPENKAVDLDRMPGRFLKAAALIISKRLAYIFLTSLYSMVNLSVSGHVLNCYLFSKLDLQWKRTL